jgi:hypothetical protein
MRKVTIRARKSIAAYTHDVFVDGVLVGHVKKKARATSGDRTAHHIAFAVSGARLGSGSHMKYVREFFETGKSTAASDGYFKAV